MRIGMLTDYVAVDFANGPALATQTFKRNMEHRGHEVKIIGPRPADWQRQAPADSILFDSVAFRQYPGVRVPFPSPLSSLTDRPAIDVIHAHTNSLSMHWASMMREQHGIPAVHTNTIYLPGFVHHAINEDVLNFPPLVPFWDFLTNFTEQSFGNAFNDCDGLIVQCQGLVDYWRNIGLDVPLHVIQRPIDVRNFNRELGADPFKPEFDAGARLLCICRHAGEKSLDRLLKVFAHRVLPARSDASLTLVGDGPVHEELKTLARKLNVTHRVHFVGEQPQRELPVWYGYADAFAYMSMTETFGQVVSESLWMGTPVVGLDDGMGVAHQVKDEINGLLVDPKGDDVEERFAAALLRVLSDDAMRATLGEGAAKRQRETSAPEVVYRAYENAYASAAEHLAQNPPKRVGKKDAKMKMFLATQHMWPWIWKHVFLAGTGLASSSYKPKSAVPFDAAPENPADELYAHQGESEAAPARGVRRSLSRKASKPKSSARRKRDGTR
ncbi:MAG: glycosyltransferase [Myxococcales bacterium]|nr:glycosyltransferase [Myxococcales bacterium]